jgi:hypothetical protein
MSGSAVSPLSFVTAAAPLASSPPNNNGGSRLSNFSIGSSEDGGQYLEAPMLPNQPSGGQSPISVRPFSLTETFAFPKPPIASPTAASADFPNPFVDAASASSTLVPGAIVPQGEAAELQTIRRPFQPTLSDELGVNIGDQIRIVHMFDDGWAQVEKATGTGVGTSGLIPIDCLREENEELPTFLSSKRVSSYISAPQ